jgi:glyoxylase I family protein
MPSFERAHHMGLTVSDNQASAEWYQRVLGFKFVKQFEEGIPRILLQHLDSLFHVSLYNHDDRTGDRFNPLRTGLDHVAVSVSDETQLNAWLAHLDDLAVPHSGVHDLGHARFVSLEDPDGIQIELWLTIVPFQPA